MRSSMASCGFRTRITTTDAVIIEIIEVRDGRLRLGNVMPRSEGVRGPRNTRSATEN